MTENSSGSSGYPITVRFDEDQRINQLWGIPILGYLVRSLILIPHFIVLWIYGIVVGIAFLVVWIPVLFTGRFPGWGYSIFGGYIRWYTRVAAYFLLMVGPYPPFSNGPGYPVEVEFDQGERINNLWGIPILGFMIRALLLIPHVIALWLVGIAAGILLIFTWIPVLLFGRFPKIGYTIIGGYLRWAARTTAWLFLMAVPYPPFRLGN